MPEKDDGLAEVTPVSFKRDKPLQPDEEVDLSDARQVTPFKVIRRGEDSIDNDDRVTFSDFSPRVVPADTPEEIVVPKAVSAPEPAPSQESTQTPVQTSSEPTVQTPANKGPGKKENG